MPFEFVESLPAGTRGEVFTRAEQDEFEENPGKWACVAEDTLNAQKYVNWARNPARGGKESPWRVKTVAHRDGDGNPHIEYGEVKTGPNKGNRTEKRYVDVWVSYDPAHVAKTGRGETDETDDGIDADQ